MPLVSDSIPNLINGVSEQPFALRLPSQSEAQQNFHSSPVEGLTRRPPTRHITSLSGDWSAVFTHPIDRDENEQYFVKITNGDLEVIDIDGVSQTVNFPSGKTYLTGSTSHFRALTVADFTFIVNTSITTAMTADLTPVRNPEALVSIRTSNYGRTFKIHINNVQVGTHTTPNGDVASDANKIDTDYIANQLKADLEVNLDPALFQVKRVASTLRIASLDGADFTIYAEDGTGGKGSVVVKDKVQRFTDLPRAAFRHFRVEVVGDNTSSFDNYHVVYDSPDALKDTDGVWTETVKAGIPYKIDPATMPHTLVRESDGTFTFAPTSWVDRMVGDEDSAPEPSFIGRKINSVFFYRNRLGFLSDENVIMSEAGGFFNFFPTTVTTILDGNNIDVAASHTRVSVLKHAVPFNEQLLLFSDDTQFTLEGGAILTPNTVRIQQTTEFESDASIKPIALGTHIYFPVKQGKASNLREYYAARQGEVNEAVNASSHVPTLVPPNLRTVAGSSSLDMLAMLSADTANTLYIYKYFFSGEDKLQSAWYPWVFAEGDDILSFVIIETTMYLIIKRAGGVFLESADLSPKATAEGSTFQYYVDRTLYETDFISTSWDLESNETTFTLPYEEDGELWVFTRPNSPSYPEAATLTHTRPTLTTVVVPGDVRNEKLCVGRKITSSYTFSPFLIRDETSQGRVPITTGRLQVLYLTVSYADSGPFDISVTPDGGDTFTQSFTGKVVGSLEFLLDEPQVETGYFRVPVYAENTTVKITITTDHFMPASFMSAEWEGRYSPRSRRV